MTDDLFMKFVLEVLATSTPSMSIINCEEL